MRWLSLLCLVLVACSSPEEKKLYRIARDPLWYSLHLEGRDAAVLGFTDDLLLTIASLEKFEVQLITTGWSSLEDGLIDEKWDAICSPIRPILHFADLYSFSKPYLLLGPVLVVPYSSSASSLSDMQGKIVGILAHSSTVLLLEQFPTIVIRPYMSFEMGLEALVKDNIDGLMLPNLIASAYIRDLYSGILRIATPPFTDEGLRLLTMHGKNQELIDKFNSGLNTLKANGGYEALLRKWKLM